MPGSPEARWVCCVYSENGVLLVHLLPDLEVIRTQLPRDAELARLVLPPRLLHRDGAVLTRRQLPRAAELGVDLLFGELLLEFRKRAARSGELKDGTKVDLLTVCIRTTHSWRPSVAQRVAAAAARQRTGAWCHGTVDVWQHLPSRAHSLDGIDSTSRAVTYEYKSACACPSASSGNSCRSKRLPCTSSISP